MSLGNDEKITTYMRRCDNPYMLVRNIAEIARERADVVGDGVHISESDALTWVIQNKEPELLQEYKKGEVMTKSQKNKEIVDETLCYIEDADIRLGYKKSIIECLQRKKIYFVYPSAINKDESKKARIRILVKMTFEKLYF